MFTGCVGKLQLNRLYKSCGETKQLNRLYKSCGETKHLNHNVHRLCGETTVKSVVQIMW